MKLNKGLKFVGVMKMLNVRSVSLGIKMEFYERLVVATVMVERKLEV